MSVPPDRMASRAPSGAVSPVQSNKIMGLPKWAFWTIIAAGLILAYYIYKKNQASSTTAATSGNTDNGQLASDLGGTPDQNGLSFNDVATLEAQLQQEQNSISQLQQEVSGTAAAGVGPGGIPPNNPGGLGGGTGGFDNSIAGPPDRTPIGITTTPISYTGGGVITRNG